MAVSRPSSLRSVLLFSVAASVLALAACSSSDGSSPDVTTGTVDRSVTTTTTATRATAPPTSDDSASGLAGLWVASPTGISDERGERYATPGAGETLRSPVDDGTGGVYFLRCTDTAPNCSIEHVLERNGTPAVIGEANRLLGLGTYEQWNVLVTQWTNPALTPSMELDVSGDMMRLVDVDGRTVIGSFNWFGWESGPFEADVEHGVFATCMGEGESCELGTRTSPDGVSTVVPGSDFATVTSLVLDPAGQRLTWIERAPMEGGVTARAVDLPSGTVSDTVLRSDTDPLADDSVTDGSWAAVRVGETVFMTELANEATTGTWTVPGGTTELAIRSQGGASPAASSL